VGDGRDREALQRAAGPSVHFTGHVSDEQVRHRLMSCRAFLFPGEEDFGITPVEAMAAGRPVVAYAGGGALDTVHEPDTGRLFSPQTVEALADTLSAAGGETYDHHRIREHAATFDTKRFRHEMVALVERAWKEHRAQHIVAPAARASV
jgi:glycosyltransferase involved in cell wall biosynthesis